MNISTRLALRNLGRSPRRTLLSILGIGVGCAVALVALALMQRQGESFIQSAADGGTGHLRVVSDTWVKTRDNGERLPEWEAAMKAAVAIPEVVVAAPRARAQALLAMGTRTLDTEVLGVDPKAEPQAYRFVRALAEGRYLEPGDQGKIVLGAKAAKRLDIGLSDRVVVNAVGEGGNVSPQIFRVVGLVNSGAQEIDERLAHVTLADMEAMTGLPGPGEITLVLEDHTQVDDVWEALSPALPVGNALLTWREIARELFTVVVITTGVWGISTLVVILVVLIGDTSAQMATVLERRREFGVLNALGARRSQVMNLLLVEALLLGSAGAILGLMIAGPGVYYLSEEGLRLMAESVDLGSVRFEPLLYARFGFWMVPAAFILSCTSTLLASIYPATLAVDTDPIKVMRSAG